MTGFTPISTKRRSGCATWPFPSQTPIPDQGGRTRRPGAASPKAATRAFIMKTGTMVSYAKKRTTDHIGRFNQLYEQLQTGSINEGWLADVESKDNIFPHIDYRIYAHPLGELVSAL